MPKVKEEEVGWRAALTALVLLGCSPALADDERPENPVFDALVRRGVSVADDAVKLPEPLLPAESDGKTQTDVIRKLASKKYGYDEFVRKSPVAPFVLEIKTVGEGEADRVQKVDLWFVAYGSLDRITNEDLLNQLLSGGESRSEKGGSEPLTDEELKDRNLKVESSDERRESYFRIEAPLLDKVQISGIGHGFTTRGSTSILAASALDPQFADDPNYPNRWRPIRRSAAGKTELGEPKPYAGFGGYCQAVTLKEPRGALFLECHMAVHEPHGWFHGAKLLRSKLPVLMQDNVRTLRRKLAK